MLSRLCLAIITQHSARAALPCILQAGVQTKKSLKKGEWEKQYRTLRAFQQHHGHSNVPKRWPIHPSLGLWVHQQRIAQKNGRLSPKQIERLEELDMRWFSLGSAFEKRLAQVESFVNEHGHARIPTKRLNKGRTKRKREAKARGEEWSEEEDPLKELGQWLGQQQDKWRRNRLPLVHEHALSALGVEWVMDERKEYRKRVRELRHFRKRHGHCRVPKGYAGGKKLAKWVERQRRAYASGRLSQEKIKELNKLGFAWQHK